EAAEVLLPPPALAQRLPLLLEELRADAGAPVGGDLDALPAAGRMPLLVKPAAPPPGGGQGDEAPAADGEHGPHDVVQAVGHQGGLVDHQQGHAAVAADGALVAGQADDAA